MAALPCIWEQLLVWYPRWLRPGKHEDHKMGNGKAASLNPPVGTPKKDSSIFIHMGVKTAHYHPRFVGQPSSGQPLSTGHSFSPIYFVEARGSPSHNRFHNADYIIGINQLHLGWVKACKSHIEVLKETWKHGSPAPTPSSKRQDTHKRRASP